MIVQPRPSRAKVSLRLSLQPIHMYIFDRESPEGRLEEMAEA